MQITRSVEAARQISPDWPHLAGDVKAPVRKAIARRLFLASVRGLKLSVLMPSGQVYGSGAGEFGNGGDPRLRIVDPDCFFSRIGRDGALGFGESFLLGAWQAGDGSSAVQDGDELAAWLAAYAASLRARESGPIMQARRLWHSGLPISERNSVAGARRNVSAHYDLDWRLFSLFLDASMTYSSALFEPRLTAGATADDLGAAQLRKTDAILDLAEVGKGDAILDIGSGFGALAFRAAQEREADVTGITLSENQLRYARGRARQLRLEDKVKFLAEDYRDHLGRYDAIVSVEMIEAVGAAYWIDFFSAVDRLLASGGRFALQVITFPHDKMLASVNDFSWVDRYIFPGGALLSLRRISQILRSSTELEIVEARRLTDSYAMTLRQWRHRFLKAADSVRALGFDDIFIRLWVLYFAYFEAGFRSRYCDVWQLGMRKPVGAR